MSTTRKMVITLGAPVVVLVGLVCVWGLRNAALLKAQIETWADSLEHSSNPVTMNLPFVPMYVDGRKVGKLETVVVQRDQPGAVDSLRLVVALAEADYADWLSGCQFRLDTDAFDRGPMGFKRAVRCISHTDGLVRFGSVVVAGAVGEAGLYLEMDDLPCDHMSRRGAGPCIEVRDEIRRLSHEIRDDIRIEIRNVRGEIRRSMR